ncbi:MAG: polymer-forming cytoskeletal protein [Deltaproteobacteria bacterium]|nr:polymer-forming cytoskeletal protein [Deltaproteobacteria bacterium]MBW2052012.1 polymer-forming cytoskeletal protein [Deltaproteobacteria bacterium]MBW2139958.1 polymer-forming cytoskeletal protein [Deltaproteobacteria bacterium]MBW2322191.1 polymer-forming cytoskeletal protein [Deltaproteobacteria bacterium]
MRKKGAARSLTSGKDISAFIGLGTEFQGQLNFDGVVRLDGRFSGEIYSTGTLIIGETAHVSAEINVDTVIISGEVHGNVRAKNRVEFHAPAKLYGNIFSPVLTIDEGVIFEGNCEMAEVIEGEDADKTITLISKEGEVRADHELI